MMMMNKSQEQFASPQKRFFRHIKRAPFIIYEGLAATAAAVATLVAAALATAIAVVDQQQDDDDEQKPRAVCFAAKEITQTHTRLSPFPCNRRNNSCFHFILCRFF